MDGTRSPHAPASQQSPKPTLSDENWERVNDPVSGYAYVCLTRFLVWKLFQNCNFDGINVLMAFLIIREGTTCIRQLAPAAGTRLVLQHCMFITMMLIHMLIHGGSLYTITV